MQLKDIRSFIECYETRSINKASKTLYISPQGLGKILDRLELELHIKLFERTKTGLIPTNAGIIFYEKGQQILRDTDDLEKELGKLKREKELFRVGYSCGLSRSLSLDKMDFFQDKYSNYELIWEEGQNPDIKQKLIAGDLDVALVIGRLAASDYVEQEINSRDLCAVVPKGHDYYNRDKLEINDLKEKNIIILNEKYQSYHNFVQSCEHAGFYPNIKIKTMEAAMIYEFVENGLGIGIDVNIHKGGNINKDIKLIPIVDAIPWAIYVAFNKKNKDSAIIKEFIKKIIKKK